MFPPTKRLKTWNEICRGWGASQFQRLSSPPKKSLQRKQAVTPPLGSGEAILKLIFVIIFFRIEKHFLSNATDMFRWRYFRTVQRRMRPRQRTFFEMSSPEYWTMCVHTHTEHKKQEALIALLYSVQYAGCGEENKLRHIARVKKNNPKCHIAVVGKRGVFKNWSSSHLPSESSKFSDVCLTQIFEGSGVVLTTDAQDVWKLSVRFFLSCPH